MDCLSCVDARGPILLFLIATMVRITERLQTPAKADATLTLSFEQRQKSRQRVRLDSGERRVSVSRTEPCFA
ncbi:MAG: hypothetical protein H0T87_04020, partial [Gammaproteobacteria bacterium]|nr:hypothetical protein [Gammaproteobacteria bacterium]